MKYTDKQNDLQIYNANANFSPICNYLKFVISVRLNKESTIIANNIVITLINNRCPFLLLSSILSHELLIKPVNEFS